MKKTNVRLDNGMTIREFEDLAITNFKIKLAPPPGPPPFVQGIEYFVRAYATNSVGTGYGNTILFNSGDSGFVGPAPIDGGVGFLLFVGLFYGVRKYKKNKRS